VRPQALATLTIRQIWSSNRSNDTESPVIEVISKSWKVDICVTLVCGIELDLLEVATRSQRRARVVDNICPPMSADRKRS